MDNALIGSRQDVVRLSTTAVIDNDPEVDAIRIEVQLKEGFSTAGEGSMKPSSFVLERAALKWASISIPRWAEYCITNKMEKL